MHALRLAVPAEAAAHRPTTKSDASGEGAATGFMAILSAVRRPGGGSVPDGNGRPVRLLAGGQSEGSAEAEAKTKGAWGDGAALKAMLLRPGNAAGMSKQGGEQNQGGKQAASGTNGPATGNANAKGASAPVIKANGAGASKANGAGTSRPAATITMMPIHSGGEGAGPESGGPKQARLIQGTASGGEGGRGQRGTGAPEGTKGKTAKQMPTMSGAEGATKKGQTGGEAPRRGGTPFESGKTRPGAKPATQSSSATPKATGAAQGEAGRPQGRASAANAQAATDGKHGQGQNASLLSTTKSAAADPGRRSEAAREALSQERSSRSGRTGRGAGRQVQGRAGHQGGGHQSGGHQKGGQQGHGGGQNSASPHSAGPNGTAGKARNPASPPSFSLSGSNASSGESDANALRASLTREASPTGSGMQGTDGKGAGASGTNSGAAAKSSGRPGGGAGPPRTMPSAWINAAKQGPLRTAELAGGWKAMEMSLGEDKGTMTVKARQGPEHMAVSVGFSEARVQAQVVANARQLQDAMQAQYGTDVDLSFGGEDADGSDQQPAEGGGADRSATLASGEADADEEGNGTATLRSGGRREWIG